MKFGMRFKKNRSSNNNMDEDRKRNQAHIQDLQRKIFEAKQKMDLLMRELDFFNRTNNPDVQKKQMLQRELDELKGFVMRCMSEMQKVRNEFVAKVRRPRRPRKPGERRR